MQSPSKVRTCFHGDLDRIGTIRGLQRRWGKPVKHPGNPLPFPGLPTQPLYDPNVYIEETSGRWRMWYVTLARPPVGSCQNPLAVAESPDGVHWERPAPGVIDRQLPSERNFVYASEGKAVSGAGVLLDPGDPDPARRHKLFYCTQIWTPKTGVKRDSDCRVAFSADGLHWRPYAGSPVLHVLSDSRHGVFRDASTGRYVCPVRLRMGSDGRLLYRHGDPIVPDSVRCCGRIESEDFVHWSEPELIIAPGEWTCQGDSFYGITIIPYDGEYLGLLQVFHRYAPNFGYLEEQLVISSDSRHWRPAGDSMFLTAGGPGEWDCGSVGAAPRVLVRDQDILFYYSGTPRSHGGGTLATLPEGGLGLASLRRDGFAYLRPPWQEGALTSHPFTSQGGELRVNADGGKGAVSVAVLDDAGRALPGYTHASCVPVTTDCTDALVRWTERAVLPSGTTVSLEFRVRDASLFAFSRCTDPPA